MRPVDWRELYASNRAVIERARGAPVNLPAGVGPPEGSDAWDTRTFTVAGQTRRALVHRPAGAEPQTVAPLVCMLHGCTQDAASFAAATLMNDAADRHGFVVVYPQQERGDNAQGCWNWFLPEHQARGAGEPASIAAIVRELMGTASPWAIDPRRVFVAGLSAGGAMAAILGATYPDLFAAVAVHSGLAYRSAASVGAAFTAMARGSDDPVGQGHAAHAAMGDHARAVPSIVVQGSADTQGRSGQRPTGCSSNRWPPTASRRLRPATSMSRVPRPPRVARWTAATPTRAANGRTAAASRCTSSWRSTASAMHGRAVPPAAPTPTPGGRTQPKRSGASSSGRPRANPEADAARACVRAPRLDRQASAPGSDIGFPRASLSDVTSSPRRVS